MVVGPISHLPPLGTHSLPNALAMIWWPKQRPFGGIICTRDEGEKPDIPMSLICGFVSATRFTYATSVLIHSIFSYAEAAGCHVSKIVDKER